MFVRTVHLIYLAIFALVQHMPLAVARLLLSCATLALVVALVGANQSTTHAAGFVQATGAAPSGQVFAELAFGAHGPERTIKLPEGAAHPAAAPPPVWLVAKGAPLPIGSVTVLEAQTVRTFGFSWISDAITSFAELDAPVLFGLAAFSLVFNQLLRAILPTLAGVSVGFLSVWTAVRFDIFALDGLPQGLNAMLAAGLAGAVLGALVFRITMATPNGLLARTYTAFAFSFLALGAPGLVDAMRIPAWIFPILGFLIPAIAPAFVIALAANTALDAPLHLFSPLVAVVLLAQGMFNAALLTPPPITTKPRMPRLLRSLWPPTEPKPTRIDPKGQFQWTELLEGSTR